jgi:outer membrane protein OmpA-like peptidoglycan-associated protein
MTNPDQRLLWAAFLMYALLASTPAIAENAGSVPSQEEIGRQLKLRGLPSVGKAAAPAPGPSPSVVPANLPAASPPPREAGRRPAPPLEVHPAATSTSSPSLTFNTITFEFGSAQLRPESVETLRNLGNALNQELKDEKAFVIEGHTDRTGTRTYNDALSKHRADAVKEYLVNEMGVSAERLQTVGRGYSEPIDPKHPYAAANRRVVMINAGAS